MLVELTTIDAFASLENVEPPGLDPIRFADLLGAISTHCA
jgi:hypothetical protein